MDDVSWDEMRGVHLQSETSNHAPTSVVSTKFIEASPWPNPSDSSEALKWRYKSSPWRLIPMAHY